MDLSIFKKIGLTDSEIKVYLSLLSLGSTSAGKIVEETSLYRKNLYDTLNKLIEKGLVTYVIEKKRKFFQAKDPDNLIRYLEEEKTEIDEKKKELEIILPELKLRFNELNPQIESEIYRGNEGIKTILKECLKYKEILFIGATGSVEDRLPYFWPHYNKEREIRKIHWRLLLVHEARNKSITKSKYYHYKVLPKILSGPNVIYIYGDTIANVLWLEKPLAFVIKHKALADNYKLYFNYLWKTIKT